MKNYAMLFWLLYLISCLCSVQLYQKALNKESLVFCFVLLLAGIFSRKILWGTELLVNEPGKFSQKKSHRFFLYFGKVFPSNQSHREEMKKLLKVSDRKQMYYVGLSLLAGLLFFMYIVQKSQEISLNAHLIFCLGNFVILVSLAYLNHLRFLVFFGFSYNVLLFLRNPELDLMAFVVSLFLYSFSLLIVDKVEAKEPLRFSVVQRKLKNAVLFSALLACGLFFISEKQEESIKENLGSIKAPKLSEKMANWMLDQFHEKMDDLDLKHREGINIKIKKSKIPEDKLANLEESLQLSDGQMQSLKFNKVEIGGNSGSVKSGNFGANNLGTGMKANRASIQAMNLSDRDVELILQDPSIKHSYEKELVGGNLSPEEYLNQMSARASQIGDLDDLYDSYRKNAESVIQIKRVDKEVKDASETFDQSELEGLRDSLGQLSDEEKLFLQNELEKQKREFENHLLLQSADDQKQARLISDRLKMDIQDLENNPKANGDLKKELQNFDAKLKELANKTDPELAGALAKNSISEAQTKGLQYGETPSLKLSANTPQNTNNVSGQEVKVLRTNENSKQQTLREDGAKEQRNKDFEAQNREDKKEEYVRILEFLFKGLKMLFIAAIAIFLIALFLKFFRKDIPDEKLQSRDLQKLKKKLAKMMKSQAFKSLKFEEEVLKTYHEFLLMFEILDFAKPKDQVPSYFQFQVARQFPDLHDDFSQITEHFCDVFYGKQEFSEQRKNSFYLSKQSLQKKFMNLH